MPIPGALTEGDILVTFERTLASPFICSTVGPPEPTNGG